jgi:hypothetical protein
VIKEAEIQAAMRAMYEQARLFDGELESFETAMAGLTPKQQDEARKIVLAGLQAAKDARTGR